MLTNASNFFADRMKRYLPDPFVFAIILTLALAALALVAVDDITPVDVLHSWYKGFWELLEFGMQIVLMLVSGYAVAISPPVAKRIDGIARRITSPTMVYASVVFIGCLFALVSWSWLVLTAVLARELATRVKRVDYPFLTACVYLSGTTWVFGLSSTIPLVLNTEGNFLMEEGILATTIPISSTLGSNLNLILLSFVVIASPVLMTWLRPQGKRIVEIKDLRDNLRGSPATNSTKSVAQEAAELTLPNHAISDTLNNSIMLQLAISLMGVSYIAWHFFTNGPGSIDLEIMIFIFVMLGMIFHQTPLRYVVAMKRACGNVSGILFQYPFYAGIMGIIVGTGLGKQIGSSLAQTATVKTLPMIAFFTGGLVNFAIPSAGGEWAVIGPSIIETAKVLGTEMSPEQFSKFIARLALAVAYGETLTNLIQPFFILIILPVMGAGVRLQARDVMGYVFIPFIAYMLVYLAFICSVSM